MREYGPSTNPLMTADEYERNRRTAATALRASVEQHYPEWSDATTPRTERPVRFQTYLPLNPNGAPRPVARVIREG